MTRRKRRNHSPTFTPLRVGFAQGQVAIAALKGNKTLAELAQQFDVHPNPITDWKMQLMDRSAQVRFPRFFVCQRVVFMLPVFPDVAC